MTTAVTDVAAIEARELYRFFHAGDDETFALRGVSLRVDPGEIVAVVGPSGAGKSTLVSCIAGLDEPDGGSVRIAGAVMTRRPEPDRAALRARRIGMLFQHGNLVEHLSLVDNIRLARRLAGHDAGGDDVLEAVALGARRHAAPSELSGGESARAALAVALANEPAVVLADEPTGELDHTNAAIVLDLLVERSECGVAVVVVTHDSAIASAADRVVHMLDGRLER